jgi:hypothetical protein
MARDASQSWTRGLGQRSRYTPGLAVMNGIAKGFTKIFLFILVGRQG